jgi:tripartite-type tricarboxylate transporter receptor subunit TctC
MKWSAFAVTLAAVASMGTATLAQDAWPTKAVVVVAPFAAGGNTDVLARIFAERLSARLRQQFVIENRAGAGGTTGVGFMTKSAADGYSMHRDGLTRGVVTLCIGGGQGIALAIETPH